MTAIPSRRPGIDYLRNRRARSFTILGRLKTGVTRREADAALRHLAAQLFLREPHAWRDTSGRGRTITALPELEARYARSGLGPDQGP